MPRGRRPVLDETCCFEICQLVAAGYSITAVARLIGRDRKTIERHVVRDQAFGLRLHSAKFLAQGRPLETVRRAAASNPSAANWLAARPRIRTPQPVQNQGHSDAETEFCRLNGDAKNQRDDLNEPMAALTAERARDSGCTTNETSAEQSPPNC
jgi:hypothetical protein